MKGFKKNIMTVEYLKAKMSRKFMFKIKGVSV